MMDKDSTKTEVETKEANTTRDVVVVTSAAEEVVTKAEEATKWVVKTREEDKEILLLNPS